jgi:hypothetical protein
LSFLPALFPNHRALADSEAAAVIAAAKLDAERIRTTAEAEADELRRASAAASARATAAAQTALTMSSRAEMGAVAADVGAEGIPDGVVIKSLADLAGKPLVVSSSAGNPAERPAASAAPAAKRFDWDVDEKENAGGHGRAAEEADTEIAAMLRAQRRQVWFCSALKMPGLPPPRALHSLRMAHWPSRPLGYTMASLEGKGPAPCAETPVSVCGEAVNGLQVMVRRSWR